MSKLYKVDLTDGEREQLLALTKKGESRARRLARAHVLLAAADGLKDAAIAAALHVGVATVERIRKRFVTGGLERALKDDPRPGAQRKLDGRQEAYLVALTCSSPPEGRERWTMQLLADRVVELQIVPDITDEAIRRLLKRTSSSPGSRRSG